MSSYSRERPATAKNPARAQTAGNQRPQSAHMGTLMNSKRPGTGVSRGARAASARAKASPNPGYPGHAELWSSLCAALQITPLKTYNIGEVVEVWRYVYVPVYIYMTTSTTRELSRATRPRWGRTPTGGPPAPPLRNPVPPPNASSRPPYTP
jgi:hypothetical protein